MQSARFCVLPPFFFLALDEKEGEKYIFLLPLPFDWIKQKFTKGDDVSSASKR